ncbi:MAG: FAD-binding oxidoreductase [Planctomycetota bacterium]|nr:FAD-binding oxidoreductase [Planctomycetota bacterium]
MRTRIKATRLTCRLCVFSCIAFLISSSFAQAPPSQSEEQPPNNVDSEKPTSQEMKDDMLRLMGQNYTPRELYPSLMQLPDLSPQKRAEIKRLARQRMEDGLKIFTESRAELAAATESNDLRGMQHAAADMRAAIARYESGLAALHALEDGEGPQEIALSWFRHELNLDSSTATGQAAIVSGMTPFHITLCVLLVVFASAMVWMYCLRMRRAAALLHKLSQPTSSSNAAPKGAAVPIASLSTKQDSATVAKQAPWSGALRVASIYSETPNVKTFRFVEPANGVIPFHYLPGQFLRLVLEIDGKPVKRAYTIASTPTRNRYLEITVKREEHGLVSGYLHERVNVGDVINITAPAGTFTFTGSEHDSIVLIGGGVGVTPLMSVVRELTDIGWDKEIYFLLSCRNRDEFIFREELEYLQERNPNLRLVVTLSREPEDLKGFHHGRITKELIANSIPGIANRSVHLCGTPQMADSIKEMLTELGVPSSEIKIEAFGTIKRNPAALDHEKPIPQTDAPRVTFSLSDKSGPLAEGVTILEAAEAIGVDIDNACRSGTCGSCMVKLMSGTVTMEVEDALSPEEKDAGMILACQAKSDAEVIVEA